MRISLKRIASLFFNHYYGDIDMPVKIVIGTLIGIAFGFVLNLQSKPNNKTRPIVLGVFALVILMFVGTSFRFGILFGLMAIAEISLGVFLSKVIFKKKKSTHKTMIVPKA